MFKNIYQLKDIGNIIYSLHIYVIWHRFLSSLTKRKWMKAKNKNKNRISTQDSSVLIHEPMILCFSDTKIFISKLFHLFLFFLFINSIIIISIIFIFYTEQIGAKDDGYAIFYFIIIVVGLGNMWLYTLNYELWNISMQLLWIYSTYNNISLWMQLNAQKMPFRTLF